METYHIINAVVVSPVLKSLLLRKDLYLTGSRFFGGWEPESDWDFFCQDTKEVRAFLEKNGFKKLSDPFQTQYIDIMISDVFRRESLTEENIDVQLVYDVKRKLATQQFIKSWIELPTNKNKRSSIWTSIDYLLNKKVTK